MTPKPPIQRENVTPSTASPGFQAKLRSSSLADLVQMECLAGVRLVVRVTSGDNVGYLYFRGGSVVHAVTAVLSGEAAAMEMLTWNAGTFEPAERDWPLKDSISSSWESLLLRAAHAHDQNRAGSVVALRAGSSERRAKTMAERPSAGESIQVDVTPLQAAGHTLRREDFRFFLRMKHDGTVVAGDADSADFADAVAYAVRLAQVIGDDLGLERFVALESTSKQGSCFIVIEDEGVVALEPHVSTDLVSLRNLFGL
jgi:hypothetical protein